MHMPRHRVVLYNEEEMKRADMPKEEQKGKKLWLARNPPAAQPIQMSPLLTRPFDTKHEHPEVHEHADYYHVQKGISEPDCFGVQFLGEPVNAKAKCKNSIIQSRIIVVNICDPCHGNKGGIVKDPPDDGIQA